MSQLAPAAADPPATSTPARAPILKGWPIVGVAWHMRQAPLPLLLQAFEDRPGHDAVFMQLGPYRATLLRHPDHVKRLFVDNAANYTKKTRGYEKARLTVGDGLVTSEGELWQRQRRIATPAFHRQRVMGFVPVFTDAAAAMLDAWRHHRRTGFQPVSSTERHRLEACATSGGDGPVVDVFREMMRLTLRVALQSLLGTSAERELDELSPAVTEVLTRTNDVITNPLAPPMWVPTPKNRRFRRAIETIDRFVYATIARRRREQQDGKHANDLLSMLLAARDETTGQGMSDRLLRDEAVTILFAGHDTTANVLTWALYLLSTHPDQRSTIEAEVDAVLTGGRTPTADDLPNLKYTRAVIDEAMRLYPPAWMIGRAAVADDAFGPYAVRAGEFVLVSPYVCHRNPTVWDDAGNFDPTRFLDGRSDALPRFSYVPFGGGQRFCIGATFALAEATLMLAMITRAARLEPLADPPVEPWAMITLRPRYGIRARVAWRGS